MPVKPPIAVVAYSQSLVEVSWVKELGRASKITMIPHFVDSFFSSARMRAVSCPMIP
jgi:hypothetical protein